MVGERPESRPPVRSDEAARVVAGGVQLLLGGGHCVDRGGRGIRPAREELDGIGGGGGCGVDGLAAVGESADRGDHLGGRCLCLVEGAGSGVRRRGGHGVERGGGIRSGRQGELQTAPAAQADPVERVLAALQGGEFCHPVRTPSAPPRGPRARRRPPDSRQVAWGCRPPRGPCEAVDRGAARRDPQRRSRTEIFLPRTVRAAASASVTAAVGASYTVTDTQWSRTTGRVSVNRAARSRTGRRCSGPRRRRVGYRPRARAGAAAVP
ncbi:hypothetical protein GS540_29535 [Rhodococcus hoagii]|nr:hypothetical protein [Prescottella equi]